MFEQHTHSSPGTLTIQAHSLHCVAPHLLMDGCLVYIANFRIASTIIQTAEAHALNLPGALILIVLPLLLPSACCLTSSS